MLGIVHLDAVEDAIELVKSGQYGNMACFFTSSGSAARTSVTMPMPVTSVSISGFQRRWYISPSATGKIVSSVRYMGRAKTLLNFHANKSCRGALAKGLEPAFLIGIFQLNRSCI